jgi:hypothetical protein
MTLADVAEQSCQAARPDKLERVAGQIEPMPFTKRNNVHSEAHLTDKVRIARRQKWKDGADLDDGGYKKPPRDGGSFGKAEPRQYRPESMRGGTQEGLRHGRVERIGNEKASRISILVIIKDKSIG